MLAITTTYNVIRGTIFIHQRQKDILDARTLLIDGIIERINEPINCFYHLYSIEPSARFRIMRPQFGLIIAEFLKFYAFRMVQK